MERGLHATSGSSIAADDSAIGWDNTAVFPLIDVYANFFSKRLHLFRLFPNIIFGATLEIFILPNSSSKNAVSVKNTKILKNLTRFR